MRRRTNALIFIKGAQDEVAGMFFTSSQDWFWWKQLILFFFLLQHHHNRISVLYESMTSGRLSLPYLMRWWTWAAVVLRRQWDVPAVHFHRLSITTVCSAIRFPRKSCKSCISETDHRSAGTLPELCMTSAKTVSSCCGCSGPNLVEGRLYSAHKSIANNKAAHSAGECWIYYGWCNLLSCCLRSFVTINQRAAGPKEQFGRLQSYSIA